MNIKPLMHLTRMVAVFLAIFSTATLFLSSPIYGYDQEIEALSASLQKIITESGEKTAAVVDLTDLHGNVSELGRFLSEEISGNLAGSTSGFDIIDRGHLKALIEEHKLAMSGLLNPATIKAVGKISGAGVLVTGTITPFGDTIRIRCKIIDTQTAKVIGSAKEEISRTITLSQLLSESVTTASDTVKRNNKGTVPAKTNEESASNQKFTRSQPQTDGRSHQKTDIMRFDNWEILDGNWQAAGNAFIGSGGHLIFNQTFRNYIFEVTVEHLSGPKSGVCVGTRSTVIPGGTKKFRNNTSDIQGYAFNFTFSKTYNLFNGIAGNWYLLNPQWQKWEWQHSDILREDAMRIRIEAQGLDVKIFVNNRFLAGYTSSSHLVGAPYLWVQMPSETVRFSNMKITKNMP